MLGGMSSQQRRTVIAGLVVVGAVAGTLWWNRQTRGSHQVAATPARAAGATARTGTLPALPATRSGALPMPGGADEPASASAPHREIPMREVDPVADHAQRAAQELEYRVYRLRFTLAEAASHCSSATDAPDAMRLAYTMVVSNEAVRMANVRVLESTVRQPVVADCMVQAVRDLSTIAQGVPDGSYPAEVKLSLHDLYDVNRRQNAQNAATTP